MEPYSGSSTLTPLRPWQRDVHSVGDYVGKLIEFESTLMRDDCRAGQPRYSKGPAAGAVFVPGATTPRSARYRPAVTVARELLAIVLLVIVATVAGCAVGGSKATSAIPGSQLLEPAKLSVCTDPTRPPLEYRARDGVLRGFDVDLLTEIARRLSRRSGWTSSVATSRAR